MRGKTNVKDGIFLNASVDTYEVATGQNIVAGNMVTMYAENGDPVTLSASALSYSAWDKHLVKLSDGKYFAVPNTILEKNASDGFDVVQNTSTSIGANNQGIAYLGNDTFITVVVSNVSVGTQRYGAKLTLTVYKIDVENNYAITSNQTVVSDSNPIANYAFTGIKCNVLDYLDGKLIGYISVQKTSSTPYSYGYTIFHIDYTDVDNLITTFDMTEWNTSSTSIGNSDEIYTGSRYAKNNANYYMSGTTIHKFYFDNGTLKRDTCQLFSNSVSNPTIYFIDDDIKVGFFQQANTGLWLVEYAMSGFVSTGFIKSALVDSRFTDTGSAYYPNLIQYDNNSFILYVAVTATYYHSFVSYCTIANNEIEVGEFVEWETIIANDNVLTFADEPNSNVKGIIWGKAITGNSRTAVAFAKIMNGQLVIAGENAQYVKNATNEQYIRGIAKQSGTAGDTIEVYVPTV